MSATGAQALHDLSDFAGFLAALEDGGFEFAVIGGCAVGAYAHLSGQTLVSADLDIIIPKEAMRDLLAWAPRQGIAVYKRPQPRSLQVAFLEWDGKEINALTGSTGLHPDTVIRTAREFSLSSADGLLVPVADPFDLLVNKLAVRREKDLPHIEILRQFVEEEVVTAFREETGRKRLMPARRLLRVLGQEELPEHLAERLLDEARMPVDFRFLMGRVPSRALAERVLADSPEDDALREELVGILDGRGFEAR